MQWRPPRSQTARLRVSEIIALTLIGNEILQHSWCPKSSQMLYRRSISRPKLRPFEQVATPAAAVHVTDRERPDTPTGFEDRWEASSSAILASPCSFHLVPRGNATSGIVHRSRSRTTFQSDCCPASCTSTSVSHRSEAQNSF